MGIGHAEQLLNSHLFSSADHLDNGNFLSHEPSTGITSVTADAAGALLQKQQHPTSFLCKDCVNGVHDPYGFASVPEKKCTAYKRSPKDFVRIFIGLLFGGVAGFYTADWICVEREKKEDQLLEDEYKEEQKKKNRGPGG